MDSDRPAESRGALCAEHRLHVAPDGLCVLCRRSAPKASSISSPGGVRWFLAAVVFGIVALGVFAFVGRERVPIANEVVVSASEPTSRAEASPVESERERERERTRRRFDAREESERRGGLGREEPIVREKREEASGEVAVEKKVREASPDEVRVALNQINVQIYTAPWCRYCNQARAFLEQNRVRFVEFNVDADPVAKAEAKLLNPRGGVPVIKIEGDVLVGFSDSSVARSLARAVEKRTGYPVRGMAN